MKLKDLRINFQLALSIGAIFLSVVLLGAVAWYQTHSLWQEIQGLYDHPLQVRRAIGELRADILDMQNGTKDFLITQNDQDRQAILQNVDSFEANANKQFDILFDRYLGPRSDIEAAYQDFVQWKAIREETLRLLYGGQISQAENRVKLGGESASQVEKINGHLQTISNFALIRGDQFLQDAQTRRDTLMSWLGIMLVAILILSVCIGIILLKGIREPLYELTAVTEQYRLGNLNARSHYLSSNEFGNLAASFNSLVDTVQADTENRKNAAEVVNAMLQEVDLQLFCHRLLQSLLEHTGSHAGAVYLINDRKTAFDHLASLGLGAVGRASFSASDYEGEFGPALASHKIQHISNLPPETQFTFAAVSGDFTPRAILTIPILAGRDVIAVISLTSLVDYPASALRLVHDLWGTLTARLNGVLDFRQARLFSEKLEIQNRELAEQTRELNQQNTELERQKDELDAANRLKGTFLSNMSHELRTPLNSVIALTGVLNRRLRGIIPEEEYSYLDVIERNGRRLLSMINDILDLSRIEAGREEINLSRLSIRSLVGEVVEMLEPLAQEKDIALLNRVSGDLPVITSDDAKCRHILQNLVANAVKFTHQGQVEIKADQVGEVIQITVTDTGIGIAADHLPHIFEEFRQGDESTSRKYGGAGLGLAIAQKYAQLLHGNILVDSSVGKGSNFTLCLPVELSSIPEGDLQLPGLSHFASDHFAQRAHLPSGSARTILLVEDSEPAIIQLKDILIGAGYNVQAARSGLEALEIIQSAPPDAMILDLMMPEVDGFQVLRMIRERETTASLPVLILTAKHVTRQELTFLKGNHIHQLIQKGDINRSALLEAVARMVYPPESQETGQPQPASSKPQIHGVPTILVVEDNPDNQLTFKALLQDTCNLLEASDGPQGLELSRTHKVDLILLDISLPDLDGFKVFDVLREQENGQHIPVIAVTARAMKGDREQILAYGFDGYISKPIDAGLLMKTIQEMIHGQ